MEMVRDAEGQTGEQDAEAAQVAAQVDQRDAEPGGKDAHAGTVSACSRPWFMCSSRSARCARRGHG